MCSAPAMGRDCRDISPRVTVVMVGFLRRRKWMISDLP
ncbi:unnamed protein product [Rhodiola kirilowii]